MKKINFLLKYFNYLLRSQTKHDIHSPFVYDLLTKVIEDKSQPEIFKKTETIRKEFLRSNVEINVKDLGAGSQGNSPTKRKIKDIAKNAAKSPKYAQLLYRLVNHFKPETMIELGTSLGISTLYQAMANPDKKLITIEGSVEIATIAQGNFKTLQLNNIESVTGNFDDELPKILNTINKLDYVFFDGNHRKAPTLKYFHLCLSKAHNNSLFIFDDIHWSDEMEEAWETIKSHSQVIITIDLFFLGLVFFRKEQSKENFVLRF